MKCSTRSGLRFGIVLITMAAVGVAACAPDLTWAEADSTAWSAAARTDSTESASAGIDSVPPLEDSSLRTDSTAPRERVVVHTIALAPLETPEDLEDAESARLLFEELLTEQLSAKGYRVIPSAEFGKLRFTIADSMGGAVNPVTGQVDSTRFKAIAETTRRAAQERFGADALLESRLAVHTIGFRKNKVTWLGASDKVDSDGSGRVPALSLVVRVSTTNGSAIHIGAGGIQLAYKAHTKASFWTGKVKAEFKPVERRKLFADPKRNLHAVRYALTPFAADEKEVN